MVAVCRVTVVFVETYVVVVVVVVEEDAFC